MPFSESKFRMFVDYGGTSTKENSTTLNLVGRNEGLTSINFFFGDGTINTLGEYDNSNVCHKTTLNCSN